MSVFEQILVAFILGVTVSAVYTYYVKSVLGRLVRGLFQANAFDEETAVTIEEAGCKNNFFIRYSLGPGTDFSETVKKSGSTYPRRQNRKRKTNIRTRALPSTLCCLPYLPLR